MSNDRQKRAERAEQMRKEREKADKRQRNLITIAIVAVVIVLVGVAAWGVTTMSEDNGPEAFGITYGPEEVGAEVAEGQDEPVKVELYEDFQCPACAAFESAFGQELKDRVASGQIEITYRPYSFLDRASLNDYSSRAHNAAMCVYEQEGTEKYVEFHEYLYANQPPEGTAGPENEDLIAAAEGLGVTGIEDCVNDGTYDGRIERAREAGSEAGVTSTPTVFIDGEKLDYNGTLLEAIDAAAGA